MKVYVDELPKSCDKCKFYECQIDIVGEWGIEKHRHICKINGSLIQGICPLQSLAKHDKQVRNEVVRELKDKIMDYYIKGNTAWFNVEKLDKDIVWKILDQIQGE